MRGRILLAAATLVLAGCGGDDGPDLPTTSNAEHTRLIELCADGDMVACDDLYLDSPIDSPEEEFGDTCGGRQPSDTGQWCVDVFGERA